PATPLDVGSRAASCAGAGRSTRRWVWVLGGNHSTGAGTGGVAVAIAALQQVRVAHHDALHYAVARRRHGTVPAGTRPQPLVDDLPRCGSAPAHTTRPAATAARGAAGVCTSVRRARPVVRLPGASVSPSGWGAASGLGHRPLEEQRQGGTPPHSPPARAQAGGECGLDGRGPGGGGRWPRQRHLT